MKFEIKRMIGMALAGAACLCCACSGGASLDITGGPGLLPAPQLTSISGKTVSGAPKGIYLTWTRIADPRVTGYYVYRDTSSIPDPGPDGTLPPGLRTNGGAEVPQPAVGDSVSFDDLFDITIGVEYFYRVTTVDNQDPPQESYPSGEESWVAHGHSVVGLDPLTAYWGDDVTITGDTFGAFDPATDIVQFEQSGGGTLEGSIVSWDESEITVTVPEGADDGVLTVLIDGTIAQTDVPLLILNPFVDALEPQLGFLEQPVVITGRNFGATQSVSKVYFGAINATDGILSWSDTEISVIAPATVTGPEEVSTVVLTHLSTTKLFTPRTEILAATPPNSQSGEPLILSGRFFGTNEGRVLLDGTIELTVESWLDYFVVVTIAGIPGNHTFTVETEDLVLSNDFNYAIGGDLGIELTGLNANLTYLPGMDPAIGVTTAFDADRVELLVDGAPVAESTTLPFNDLVLTIGDFNNGHHDVQLKVYRRSLTAMSNIVETTMYSLVGDIDGDGEVNSFDVFELGMHIGAQTGQPDFEPWYDADGDGVVTEADLALVGYNFGNSVL